MNTLIYEKSSILLFSSHFALDGDDLFCLIA